MSEKNKQVALITGAGKRIGRALALALGNRGFQVAVHCRDSEDEARQVLDLLQEKGCKAHLFKADLANDVELKRLIPEVLGSFGRLDLLVNNAAVFRPGGLLSGSIDLIDEHLAVNLRVPLLLMRFYARYQEQGHVINLLDSRIAYTEVDHFAYTLSKKALAAATRMAALELAPAFRVNGVAPGPILAPLGQSADYLAEKGSRVPLARAGRPKHLIQAVNYLLDNDYVTGQVLFVDGGMRMGDREVRP